MFMNKKLLTISLIFVFAGLFSCSEDETYQTLLEDERNERLNYLAEHGITEKAVIEGGVYYQELLAGEGDTAKIGDNVAVYYTGYFLDGRIFDTNVLDGKYEPLTVQLAGIYTGYIVQNGVASGTVIQGWPPALLQMQAGSKARVVVPSSLAYGIYGSSGIPGYTTLIFEIEMVDIRRP